MILPLDYLSGDGVWALVSALQRLDTFKGALIAILPEYQDNKVFKLYLVFDSGETDDGLGSVIDTLQTATNFVVNSTRFARHE